MNPKPVDVNWIVERAERLLHRLIGENITMRTRLLPEGIRVFADAIQMEQVLINLATNSRDAMPDGGNLVIETDQVVADDAFVQQHGLRRRGVFALITVSDTGTGMDEATLEKIFEPFFTTKEVGKGTGLGLANVYGIVKQHNGTIEVKSALDRGTSFHIYLPAIQTVAEDMRSAETVPPPGGAETVLVAEDEESVRIMTAAILKNFGYTVHSCGDGEEAVRLFAANRDSIDLVLLDVIMPKLNGREAYEEMSALKPGIKVLYTSGYTFDVIHAKGVLDTRRPFLPKPASPAELLKKVREVLDR
jgi:CheY-like chemotaxis protein